MSILDIFYNYIIKEAATGTIYSYFNYNILFNTHILETNEVYESDILIEGVNIPTLQIKDKKLFDKLLLEYVNIALDFYPLDNYEEDVLNRWEFTTLGVSREKTILALLWSNATYEDFLDPITFLRKKIAFLKNDISLEEINLGEAKQLNSNIFLRIEKDKIYNETPFKMVLKCVNDNNQEYYFPEIKFGICDDAIYIYAIQSRENLNSSFKKKINRILFKIGESFNEKEDNYEIYAEGNLKDVTSSFVVALNMAIAYFHNLGYEKFSIPSIMPVRWNAKYISFNKKFKNHKLSEDSRQNILEHQNKIQSNLTEKFLRTFLRLQYHYKDNIEILSLPMVVDSNLHLLVEGDMYSNNSLLNETSLLMTSGKRLLFTAQMRDK